MEIIRSPQIGDKPALLLDVEGVFLVVNEDHPDVPPSDSFEKFNPEDYDFYNPRHGDWIKQLLPEFDAYWLTGVGSETVEVLGPRLGLADIPQIDYEYIYGTASERPKSSKYDFLSYKRFAIDHILPDRRLVWVDDCLARYDIDWAQARLNRGVETFLVQPNGRQGLRYPHIERIQAWLGELAAPESSI